MEICKTDRCAIDCLKCGIPGAIEFSLDNRRLTTQANYVHDIDGNPIGFIEIIEDITDRYKQDIAIQDKAYEMQQFHAAVFDSCNIIMFSDEGMITDVNEKLLNIFSGYSKSEFIGKHMSEFISKECYQTVWEHLTQGKSYEETQPIDTGSGVQNFHHKYMPICDRSGKMLWILLILYRQA